jgi:hypothetical protein
MVSESWGRNESTHTNRDPAAEMDAASVEGQTVSVQSGFDVAAEPVYLS